MHSNFTYIIVADIASFIVLSYPTELSLFSTQFEFASWSIEPSPTGP
jgi:hypothetical protein